MEFNHLYTSGLVLGDTIPDFYIRIDTEGFPLLIDKSGEQLFLLAKNTQIAFEDLQQDMYYLYDVKKEGETLSFIGGLKDKSIVKGQFRLDSNVSWAKKIATFQALSNALFDGDIIKLCIKDTEVDELSFKQFEF